MSPFLLNLLLALAWAATIGQFTWPNFLLGFAIGFVALLFVRDRLGSPAYFSKLFKAVTLGAYFIGDLTMSSVRVARDVVSPRKWQRMRPGIISVPLDVERDVEIMLLANLITATPGTLSLDISEDHKVLYIHAMYVDDVEEMRRDIKDGFERRVLELFR